MSSLPVVQNVESQGQVTNDVIVSANPEHGNSREDSEESAQNLEQFRKELEEAILMYRNKSFEERPKIPRIFLSATNRSTVQAINTLLPAYFENSTSLEIRTRFCSALPWQFVEL